MPVCMGTHTDIHPQTHNTYQYSPRPATHGDTCTYGHYGHYCTHMQNTNFCPILSPLLGGIKQKLLLVPGELIPEARWVAPGLILLNQVLFLLQHWSLTEWHSQNVTDIFVSVWSEWSSSPSPTLLFLSHLHTFRRAGWHYVRRCLFLPSTHSTTVS